MAASAVVSESAVMHIVSIMAVNATTTCGVYLVARARMTGRTGESPVGTVEREAGVLVMIEIPNAPVPRVVASVTGRAQPSLVRIVLAVATHAGARRVPEPHCGVAFGAHYFLVTSEQRKARGGMIEARSLPARLRVTTLATRALLTGVNVILTMARHAFGLQLLPECAIGMASLALHLGMHAK